jgi:protein-L-isoaspartate(D-aspartate) O-methyltransferase
MVSEHLAARDITDARVLAAMAKVPRHDFVPAELANQAYDDRPLPIGHDATISQPYVVAFMTQALGIAPTDRVLEVGTGSGYGAAVLAELALHVTTIEFVAELADLAALRLVDYGERVEVIHGDGSLGAPDAAPFDVISVTAGARQIPEPLLEQLAPGGRLVIPVGRGAEELIRITRTPTGDVRESLLGVRFVPLRGRHGIGH